MNSNWANGIFDCGNDCGICCVACWCPCITYGQNVQKFDRNQGWEVPCLMYFGLNWIAAAGFVLSCLKRGEIRNRFGIPGDACQDCCCHFWCTACVLTQEQLELERRLPQQPNTVLVMNAPGQPQMYQNQPRQF